MRRIWLISDSVSSNTLSEKWIVNKSKSTQRWTQLIIKAESSHTGCPVLFSKRNKNKNFGWILMFCHWFLVTNENHEFQYKKNIILVFCYQNCSDLLWEKIVLVFGKTFCKIFEDKSAFNRFLLKGLGLLLFQKLQ